MNVRLTELEARFVAAIQSIANDLEHEPDLEPAAVVARLHAIVKTYLEESGADEK